MKYRLGDLCNIVSGSTPKTNIPEYWGGNFKWVTPAELSDDSYIVYDTVRKITELGVSKTALNSFPAGTVLLSSRAPIGKLAIAGCDMYCNQGFKNFICSSKIYNKYLFWFLKSKKDFLNSLGRGATFKEISKQIVADIEIELPEFNEQIKISSIFEKISNLISLRNQQLEQLDLLIKSRFVEMFGDPVNNDKDWESKKLKEICNKITDGTHDTPKRVKDGYLLITGKNIRSSGIIFDEIEYVSSNDHKTIYARCNPEYGDVLYTNIGVNFCTACFNNLNYEFSMKNVALLKPNKAILNGKYLCLTLNLLRNKIVEKNKVGGAQTFLGLATIKMIEVPLPPLALQNQFAAFVEEVERTKATVKQSLEWLNTLKAKLMQDFFG